MSKKGWGVATATQNHDGEIERQRLMQQLEQEQQTRLSLFGNELQAWLAERHLTLVVSCAFDNEGRHRSQIRLVPIEG